MFENGSEIRLPRHPPVIPKGSSHQKIISRDSPENCFLTVSLEMNYPFVILATNSFICFNFVVGTFALFPQNEINYFEI